MIPKGDFEAEMERRLGGARRVAFVGIGDELQPRDRLGMLAAREIDALRLKDVRVFLAGSVPESFTAPIRRLRPDHVILLDAADMGLRPGTVDVIDASRVQGTRLSTHALPLSVVIEYLEAVVKVPVTLIGIQPDLAHGGPAPTPAEAAGITRIVACAHRCLSDRPRTTAGPSVRVPYV